MGMIISDAGLALNFPVQLPPHNSYVYTFVNGIQIQVVWKSPGNVDGRKVLVYNKPQLTEGEIFYGTGRNEQDL